MTKPSPLQPGLYYHIYNRGNNGDNLFFETRNYSYFFNLYTKYILPVASTYAYCLLRNHFHLLIRIDTVLEQREKWGLFYQDKPYCEQSASRSFSNLFNAYAKAIQKAYSRTGSLFEHPYHRIQVKSSAHYSNLVTYIHRNPQKHGFVDDFRDWPFSSYNSLASLAPTQLDREKTLSWFTDVTGYYHAHQSMGKHEEIMYLIGDDE